MMSDSFQTPLFPLMKRVGNRMLPCLIPKIHKSICLPFKCFTLPLTFPTISYPSPACLISNSPTS